jgi:hypothetical protein
MDLVALLVATFHSDRDYGRRREDREARVHDQGSEKRLMRRG